VLPWRPDRLALRCYAAGLASKLLNTMASLGMPDSYRVT
jgi:hypothetical protein